MALLAQLVDGVVVSKFPLDKQVHTIGRNARNDITIDDVAVSSQHAIIESRENSYLEGYCDYILIDKDSTNGTFVNDEKITEQRLMNGDLVRIAWNTFRFVDDNEFDLEKTTKILAGSQF